MSRPPSQLNDELVRAGAGAGKTTALIARVMELISHYRREHGRWPRLVVTTFTRKATQELRERLALRACELEDLELLDYCRSRSQLQISTIHGVLVLFLRRYGHLVGVDPSFAFLSEPAGRDLRRRTLREILIEHKEGAGLLETFPVDRLAMMLQAYQEAEVLHPDLKPVTGEILAQLQKQECESWIFETRSLAREVLKVDATPSWRVYGEYLELLAQWLKGIGTPEGWKQLREGLADWPRRPPRRGHEEEVSAELEERILSHKEKIAGELEDWAWSPQAAIEFARLAQEFAPLAKTYGERLLGAKLGQSTLELADLEVITAQSVRRHPEVAEAFSADWDHWLVDEFQDTSPLQIELLRQFIGNRPHYVVGDPQQSIYLFRGARVEIFTDHQNQLEAKGVQSLQLMVNYRSHPSLLHFLNDFFQSVGPHFEPMKPRTEEFEAGRMVAHFFAAAEAERNFRRESEFAAILHHIHELIRDGSVSLSDICVLARKNRQLLEVAQYLKQHGIPTHVHASRGYFERREVRDALALLRFLVHPHDNRNLIELLRSPWARVNDDDLTKSLRREGGSFWSQLQNGDLKSHPVILELESWREVSRIKGYAYAWERALVSLGYFDLSAVHDATGRREANLWKLFSSLALAERQPGFRVMDFIQQSQGTFADLDTGDEGDAVTAVEPNVVNLMTVHAAKGLQRRHVILPFCDDEPRAMRPPDFIYDENSGFWCLPVPMGEDGGMLWSPIASQSLIRQRERELAEHDRLLYVALTRAQESVFISWTGKPRGNSWANRWRWPTESNGVFQKETYSYRVHSGALETKALKELSAEKMSVRPLWRVPHVATTTSRLAVVDLLDQMGSEPGGPAAIAQPESALSAVERAVFGTQVHRLLEAIHLNPKIDWKSLADRWFDTSAEKVIEAVEYVLALKIPPMGELLKHGQAEWGFQLKTGRGLLDGQIDLWGEAADRIWLIDYKSGNPKYVEKAFLQLEIYAFALARFGHEARAELAVIYPFDRKVMKRPFCGAEKMISRYPQLSL